MTPELTEKLEYLFNIASDYFMADEYSNLEDLMDVLEEHRTLLDAPEYNQRPERTFGGSESGPGNCNRHATILYFITGSKRT